MNETWLPIPFFPNYEASTRGRIRNALTLHVLRPFKGYGREGRHYQKVNLYHRGQRFSQFVHRLVAFTFYEIDHVDRIKDHNWIENLEPVLRKENDDRWRRLARKEAAVNEVPF
jgi:hypothetical protein